MLKFIAGLLVISVLLSCTYVGFNLEYWSPSQGYSVPNIAFVSAVVLVWSKLFFKLG